MKLILKKKLKRLRRQKRVRARIRSVRKRPRLTVFRSNRHMYAQLIDDNAARTIAAASDHGLKISSKKKSVESRRRELARSVGALIADRAKKIGVSQAVFDRGRYAYHGAIKALADGARAGGLQL